MANISYVDPATIEDPELGRFIALTLSQQRFLKTLGIKHGEILADTEAGLAPAEAERLRAQRA